LFLLGTASFSYVSYVSYALEFSFDDNADITQLSGFKASELCAVAENTHHYIKNQPQDKFAVHAGTVFNSKVFNGKISLTHVEKTLAFICQTYRDDVRNKRLSRLHDKAFVKQHFDFIRWMPDKKTATEIAEKTDNAVKTRMLNSIPQDKIFLTKYYTKLLDASPVKTDIYNQALYALPHDESGLTLEQAQSKQQQLTRYQYTRQQVMSGALLDKKLAQPLVWLTAEALHDVLLQGTGVLKVDGTIRYFNVHRNNGIAYDYSIGKREQARYWYFAEVPSVMGYGVEIESKIPVKPWVTFAGNMADIGLGKLIMVKYKSGDQFVNHLGILADQGGAFDNNLFQLDLLTDSYRGWTDFHQTNKHLSDYAKAWFLVLKPQYM